MTELKSTSPAKVGLATKSDPVNYKPRPTIQENASSHSPGVELTLKLHREVFVERAVGLTEPSVKPLSLFVVHRRKEVTEARSHLQDRTSAMPLEPSMELCNGTLDRCQNNSRLAFSVEQCLKTSMIMHRLMNTFAAQVFH